MAGRTPTPTPGLNIEMESDSIGRTEVVVTDDDGKVVFERKGPKRYGSERLARQGVLRWARMNGYLGEATEAPASKPKNGNGDKEPAYLLDAKREVDRLADLAEKAQVKADAARAEAEHQEAAATGFTAAADALRSIFKKDGEA